MFITFDRNLENNNPSLANFSGLRIENTERDPTIADATLATLTIAYATTDPDPGPDEITYMPNAEPLIRSAAGVPAAAFVNFPLESI